MSKAVLCEFFSELHKGQQAAHIEVRMLPSGRKVWLPWPIFPEHQAFRQITPNIKDQIYFGVNLRNSTENGTDSNCLPSPIIRIDVDLKDLPQYTGGQTKESLLNASKEELAGYKLELKEDILAKAELHNIPPLYIVDSGHGVQVYWRREYATTHEDMRLFNKKMIALFDGDKDIHDPARILRLPFTKNIKNRKRPLLVEIIYADKDAYVTEEALEALPDPPEPEKKVAAPIPAQPLDTPTWKAPPSNDAKRAYAEAALARECEYLAAMPPDSGRNGQLNKAAHNVAMLVAAGILDEHRAKSELEAAAAASGLEAHEIPPTIKSGFEAGLKKPRDITTIGLNQTAVRAKLKGAQEQQQAGEKAKPKEKPEKEPKPTLGLLRDLLKADLDKEGHYKFHQIWKSWWEYKDGVYSELADEIMLQRADEILEKHGFDDLPTPQLKYILDKLGRTKGVRMQATSQKSNELNTRNGILNLETNEFKPHDPEYFSIIQSAAEYDPRAVAHNWKKFLMEAVPSQADRKTLQLFAGLCLTGDTSPQKALLLVGEGGTGKSTFSSVLSAVLGNLASSSAIQNIQDGSFLVGELVGKRMCVVSELPRAFDWIPFKRITGEDKITVDVKHKSPFAVKLDIKLIILSNIMPHLGEDSANSSITRRLLPVEFNVKPSQIDTGLLSRLTHPDELSGVLNWMLEGLRELEDQGMRFKDSETMNNLSQEILEESNRVITFLKDCCAMGDEFEARGKDLYRSYCSWCVEQGYKQLANNNFAKQLVAAADFLDFKIDKKRKSDGIRWQGLCVKSEHLVK